GNERVLIVEDEVSVRCLTAAILKRLGYTVLEAADGEEARTLIEREKEHLDLVVSDMVLPNSSGRDLTEWIDRSCTDLKVLFTSGYLEEVIHHKTGLDRDAPFLQKPFTVSELARKVRDLLETEDA